MARKNTLTEAIMEADGLPNEETIGVKETTKIRNDAWKKLMDYVTKSEDVPDFIMDACKTLRPSYFGIVGNPGESDGLTPSYRKLLSICPEPALGTVFTSLELFQKFRFGRTEAKNWCNELVKHPTPAGKPLVWIRYAPKEDTYTIVSIGNDIPENWTGYVPAHLNGGKAVQAK